jgi:hypothetical protein
MTYTELMKLANGLVDIRLIEPTAYGRLQNIPLRSNHLDGQRSFEPTITGHRSFTNKLRRN